MYKQFVILHWNPDHAKAFRILLWFEPFQFISDIITFELIDLKILEKRCDAINELTFQFSISGKISI